MSKVCCLTHCSDSKNTCTDHIKADWVRYTDQMTTVACCRHTPCVPGIKKVTRIVLKMISALSENSSLAQGNAVCDKSVAAGHKGVLGL